jgi:LysR family transcriptional activator of nhaA
MGWDWYYLLLEPAMQLPQGLRIICREGKPRQLLAELATHHLDIVIADSPCLPMSKYVDSITCWVNADWISLARRYRKGFPRSLDSAPFLLPREDAAVRPRQRQNETGEKRGGFIIARPLQTRPFFCRTGS